MATIRVGIVGAGRIVPAHLHGYKALRAAGFDDFRITAVCSRDAARAHALVGTDGKKAGGMAGIPSANSSTQAAVFGPTPLSEVR